LKKIQPKCLCEKCGEMFLHSSLYSNHLQNNHEKMSAKEVQSVYCKECPLAFPTRAMLNSHAMLNGLLVKDEGYSNSDQAYCQKEMATDNFICDDCSQIFKTKTSLKKHLKRIHKVKVTIQKENDPFKNNPNRKLECGLCVLEFVSLEKMDDHMDEKHSGRWKLGDSDVVFEGDEYEDSSEFSSSDEFTEDSESQRGED
jgi:uncharacterized C2H2 Zn-finger protein